MENQIVPQEVLGIIDQVITDVSQRTGIDQQRILIISWTETIWPNSALGAPQLGYSYTQVLTPGMIVHLRAGDKDYTYHTDLNSNFVTVPNPNDR